MQRTPRTSGWRPLFTGFAAFAALAGCCILAAAPATLPASQGPTTSPSDLGLGAAKKPLPLDPKPFERVAAGISFRSPLGWNGLVQADRDEVIRYVNDLKKQDWSLSVIRRTFPKPQHLFATKDPKDPTAEAVPGIVDNTLAALLKELPGAKVLRGGDPSNIGAFDVGMIVLRYTKNGERRLAQHAIIEGNNQLYYLLAFNSPGRKDVREDDASEEKTVDPTEQQAVETFRSILDSVKLLDQTAVRNDQVQRLFRTRAFINLVNEKKINNTIVPERYLRIIKEGKDIGYSYVVERTERRGGADGLFVGIHTRVMTLKDGKVYQFPREDTESQMFAVLDRRNESWTKVSVWDEDGKPKTAEHPWKKVSEFGASAHSSRRVLVADPNDPNHPENAVRRGDNSDPKNPWVNTQDTYTLNVQFKANRGDLEPVVRQLPPFYLPQAMGAMLPRLVPPREPKAYLFATYVSDLRQVALRYLDVKEEEDLPRDLMIATGMTRGIAIDDRIGYEGGVTTHYVTQRGEYLGSVTKASHLVVVPTDVKTLVEQWRLKDGTELFVLPPSIEPTAAPAASGKPAGNALINPTGPGR